MTPINENKVPHSSDDVPAFQPKKRRGVLPWLIVGIVLVLGASLAVPAFLGAPNGVNATLEPDASSKNIFEQTGPHEVLDVAKEPAPIVAENRQPEQTTSKKVFQREVFQSTWNPENKITLISDSECEIESKQGIIIASYTHEEGKMRFVFSALGSQRVGYADVYSDGIVMANEGVYRKGEPLLNAEGMRMKEEADRKAEAEQQRISLEAPKVLIGLWKQVKDSPENEEMEGVMFRADGIWASVNWQRKEATEKGHWHVKDGELNKGLFNVGTFTEGKIVELTQDRFVYERNAQKFVATRVVEGANSKKEESDGRIAGAPPNGTSGQQMAASEPQTKQEIRIDPLAGGDELDSACEVFSQRLVTAKDVSQWNFDQLRYAINFLYAKHGYVFAAREVQAVFSGRPWYKANPSVSMDDIDARMSMTENANVKVLAEAKSRLKASAN